MICTVLTKFLLVSIFIHFIIDKCGNAPAAAFAVVGDRNRLVSPACAKCYFHFHLENLPARVALLLLAGGR
jgi:hypothetical protein